MTDTDDRPVYRALSMLENEYVPLLKRRAPFWRPKPPTCFRDVHTPAWNWTHDAYEQGMELDLTFLDRNAAYLSGASSAQFAHGELKHTGAMAGPGKHPGYYRIDSHSWSDSRIVSPLGSARTEGQIWVAYPTLELLQKLSAAGYWPDVQIRDSWTCAETVRFRGWATAVNIDRAHALRQIELAEKEGSEADQAEAYDRYVTIKTGYSMAVQLMLGPSEHGTVKSAVKRPDWYHTIHAQHAASVWRDTWKCVEAGYVPIMMGSVDEVVWLTDDFLSIGSFTTPPLLKLDQSGIALGAWKVKARTIAGKEAALV